ncbi:hypothetical protein [Microbacterium sp. NPDC058389]|uniref:hypothetical protein n=1 Tax=Microbacterium sp. NPDC058389 TaxID=3346475 RepID=UPI00365BEEE6
MGFLTALVLPLLFIVIGFVALFYVVRGAVLSALRAHDAEAHRPSQSAPRYLDADGL